MFWLLAIVGVMLFLAVFFLPETLSTEKRATGSLFYTFKNYRTLLANREFMRYTLCVTFFYVAGYGFIAGSPQAYIEYFGVAPEHYGWLFSVNTVGLIVMSMLNRSLVQKMDLNRLLKIATMIAFSGIAVASLLYVGYFDNIYIIVIGVQVFFSSNGVIVATSTALALDKVPEMAGSAAALLSAMQYGSGIISSVLLALFANGTPVPMLVVMTAFTGLCVWVVRKS